MLAWVSSRNQASTSVLSATVESATTPSSFCSPMCDSTRSARASPVDWWPTYNTSASAVVSGCRKHHPCLMEATFCYLGDLLCTGGGCNSAITVRCCVAWGSSGISCPSSPLGNSHLRCASRCIWPISVQLCSKVAKDGNFQQLHCNYHCKIS